MVLSTGDTVTDDVRAFTSVGEYTTVRDTLTTLPVVHSTSPGDECFLARYNETEYLPWNNPDNILSQDAEALVAKVRDLTIACLILIGGPANLINMAVFYKQGLQDRVNLCLFMLAVSDNLYLTVSFWLHSENIYLHLSGRAIEFPLSRFVANNNIIFLMASSFVSIILSAIIACERCYCVLRPLRYQTLMSTRTMAVIILLAYVFMLSLFFFVSFKYYVQCVLDPVTGEVFFMVTGGEFYHAHKMVIDYLDSIFFGAFVSGGMMIVVVIATIVTAVRLRQIVTWRTQTSSSLSAREVALTKMLIGNSVLFIVSISPDCVFRVAALFMPHVTAGGRHHNFYVTATWIFEGSAFINSSFNFFIYYTMGSRYRETLRELFGKKTPQRKS